MLKHVILHLGSHKTGSSAIQKALITNKDKFKNLSPNITSFMFEPIFYSFYTHKDQKGLQQLKKKYKEEFRQQKHETLLFSNEDLSFCNPYYAKLLALAYPHTQKRIPLDTLSYTNDRAQCYSQLFDYFRDYDITIVIYLRRQDLFIESLYCEFLKNSNLSLPFHDFLTTYPIVKLDWNHWIEDIKKSFPTANLHIRLFEKSKLKQENVVTDFFDILNINTTHLELNKSNINERLNKESIEIIRAFNASKRCKLNVQPKEPNKLIPF